ncbi:heterokaryon incompatibility protein-domain-containing protein [Lophiotrema nucula]|uniref:Heterokaryon incompatibility protein-domain-containing protein n=1 Tax=Lophiotrema nucula TaxID=690887 RepID=A0A6A5YT43_9PLEO|nr:heterokaryon incompatibility protein-domain-containing protein [Lophiotrema nucula]
MRIRQTASANMQFLDGDARAKTRPEKIERKRYPEDWESVPFEEKLRLYIEYNTTGRGQIRQRWEANTQFLATDSARPVNHQPRSKHPQSYGKPDQGSQCHSYSASMHQGHSDWTFVSPPVLRNAKEDNVRPTTKLASTALDSNTHLANVEFFRRDISSKRNAAGVGYIRNIPSEHQPATVLNINDEKAEKANISPVINNQIEKLGELHSRDIRPLWRRRPQMVFANTRFLRGVSRTPMLDSFPPDTGTAASVKDLNSSNQLMYPPLRSDTKGSLRLLRLEPTDGATSGPEEPIKCTLVNSEPWAEHLQYECLSYCWGDVSEKESILVKLSEGSRGKYERFLITRNLHNALRRLQDSLTSRWLWVDLICINQCDIHERSSQVSFMKEIYNHAASITIWLGESDSNRLLDSSVSVIWTLWKLFSSKTGCTAHHIVGPSGLILNDDHLETLRTLDLGAILKTSMKDLYDVLANFFSLPWFRRVWVLQEAFAHASITVRVGKHSLQWSAVIVAALWQSYRTRSYTSKFSNETSGGYLPELWLSLLHSRVPKGLPILELVCRARDFQATDPRDKVFALLGMANDLDEPAKRSVHLKPDYNKSKNQVYCGFARALVEQQRNLDVLATVDTFSRPKQRGMGASWMPNLDVSVATVRGLGFPRKYNASYSTPVDLTTFCAFQNDDIISLSGYIINDRLLPHFKVLMFRSNLQLYIKDTPHAVHLIWRELLQSHAWRNLKEEESILRAFVLTVTAAGFALPTEFCVNPLGNIIPSHQVPSLMADFAAYWSLYDPQFDLFAEPLALKLMDLVPYGDADQFAVLVGKTCHERKFFLTEEGQMGLCPKDTRETDKIVILYGGSVPYILRQCSEDTWTFVGECYFDGMMFGEAKERKQKYGIEDQVFHIC